MRMLLYAGLAACLAGCTSSSLRAYSKHTAAVPVTVAEIQFAIACEFVYAFQRMRGDGRTELERWGAFVELKLAVKDSVKLTPGAGPVTLKAGNAELEAKSPGVTIDDWVKDKNSIAYTVAFTRVITRPDCPSNGSDTASSGLGLAEFLEGTSEVINAGGEIGVSGGTLPFITFAANGSQIRAPADPNADTIPTIIYNRSFQISRKAGGGLTFKLDDYSFSIGEDTGGGRERLNEDNFNTIDVTMGRLPERRDGVSPARALENSILQQRNQELQQLRELVPNQVVVVNNPPPV